MAVSINTAYADLWHRVAGRGSTTKANNIGQMAAAFGVDTKAAHITGSSDFQDQYAVALGEASLSVVEQTSMLATLADNGVYHDAHLVTSITRNNVPTPIKITSRLVFSPDPTQNAAMDSQVQAAMSEDTASYGTAPGAALSNGQPMIAKTGTTEQAQSAFFVGAIPSQALTVALFTNSQNSCDPTTTAHCQTLNGLGGQDQGGYGGTWPASIWHTYGEDMFVPLGVQQFQPAVFTGSAWNQVPQNLRQSSQPAKKKAKSTPSQGQNQNNGNQNQNQNPSGGNPNPFPTYSCDPAVVTCNPNEPATSGQAQSQGLSSGATEIATPQASAAKAGAAAGMLALLPAAALRRRRRVRRRRAGTVR
jgi:membrane peptidoglycan carboxypeptidase